MLDFVLANENLIFQLVWLLLLDRKLQQTHHIENNPLLLELIRKHKKIPFTERNNVYNHVYFRYCHVKHIIFIWGCNF